MRNLIATSAAMLLALPVASQMLPAKLKQTAVTIQNQKTEFRANGQVILFPGYMRIYVEGRDNPEADLANSVDLRDMAAYYLLFFSGVRIGHVASTAGGQSHGIRFEDLHWEPSIFTPEVVYICFRSTKTRARAADTPYWSAIARQSQLQWCPLILLQQHVIQTYQGRPDDLVFRSARGAPLARSTFVTDLRRRLGQAAYRFPRQLDLSKYAGVSFRKGFLSTLGPLVPSHRLADAADHSSVESSRIYTVDTLQMRASNSTLVASAFVHRM